MLVCCVVKKDFKSTRGDIILLRTENPYFIYSILVGMFYAEKYKKLDGDSFISPKANISSSAKIGKNVTILDGVSIEDDVEIGDNSVLEQNTVIKHGVKIGKNARIASNVSIRYSIIGDDVVILDGAKNRARRIWLCHRKRCSLQNFPFWQSYNRQRR
jgi:UDP-3-O-[3-hydroxymyristoyl] glucosamine N-acyltransferase